MLELFEFIPIIFCLSAVFALLGVGGAVIYIPLFYLLGMDLLVAIPLALLLNVVTAGSASITYIHKKTTDFHTAFPIIIAAVIGAPAGAYFTGILPEKTLLILFSLALVIAGIILIRSKDRGTEVHAIPLKKKIFFGSILGFFIGIITGLLGLGGGIFLVPMLLMLGYSTKEAPATSMLVVAFSSLSGFLAHVAEIDIEITFLAALCIAALAGSQIGSRLMYTRKLGLDSHLKIHFRHIFGVLLLFVAVMLQYWNGA
ncbi:putative membrane protein YfcA [Methanohalophilus levihalophilus]|uniref:sulfite exporter TauE/SafE family protein n=1 Tax=Methanohalophilus levihalophilus TaxID=1431282 RepID=UPI001AEA20A1|nr:sulfite exporter TauE/SafE family protein [Methanohalophilus levihalophilus]MBP2029728.1 putative membrane protein YfcA [Methanohalophilus levihalophilus]